MNSNHGNIPDGYNEDDPGLGRTKVTITNKNKQDSNFGKDRLGTQGMKGKDKNSSNDIKNNFKGGSALALESAKITFLKNKDIFKSLSKKKLIFEENKDTSSLLDENQLKE